MSQKKSQKKIQTILESETMISESDPEQVITAVPVTIESSQSSEFSKSSKSTSLVPAGRKHFDLMVDANQVAWLTFNRDKNIGTANTLNQAVFLEFQDILDELENQIVPKSQF